MFRTLRRTLLTTKPTLTPILIPRAHLMATNASIRASLKDHKIIPEVVDDFTPSALLSIEYHPTHAHATLGNILTPADAQDLPILRITPDVPDEKATYTVVLTDPDAPSREDPKWSEYCHWIVTGLRAKNERSPAIDVNRAFQVLDYMGPAPPKGTGKHRYVFLLFKGGDLDRMEAPEERKKWGDAEVRGNARRWAEKYGLELVGANFFFAKSEKD